MKEYHKINTVFKRTVDGKRLIEGEYSEPVFEYLKNNQWVFTEKVDGTNIRIMWDGTSVVFGGKTDNAQIPAFLIQKLQERFMTIEARQKLAEQFPEGGCLYGEGYGARIQKSGGNYISDGVDFVLFDVKVGDWWLEREAIEDVATKLSLRVVPIIGEGTLTDLIALGRAGFKSTWGDFNAEGVVARPKVEIKTRRGDRVITKIKHKDFQP